MHWGVSRRADEVLWALDVAWERATGSEVDVLVGWMKTARNPQRRRTRLSSTTAGVVNTRTGKPALAEGYAPRTINHCLSAVYGFYAFHGHYGRGPMINLVPSSRARRLALAQSSPIESTRPFARARLRQKVAEVTPRAIPDLMGDELFAAMTCDRDRAPRRRWELRLSLAEREEISRGLAADLSFRGDRDRVGPLTLDGQPRGHE